MKILMYVVSDMKSPAKAAELRLVCPMWNDLLLHFLFHQIHFEGEKDEEEESSDAHYFLIHWKGKYYLPVNPETNVSTYKVPDRKPWSPTDSDVVTRYALSVSAYFKFVVCCVALLYVCWGLGYVMLLGCVVVCVWCGGVVRWSGRVWCGVWCRVWCRVWC